MITFLGEFITWSTEYTTGIKDGIQNVFSDLTIPVILVIALPLAFWFIKRVIGLAREK